MDELEPWHGFIDAVVKPCGTKIQYCTFSNVILMLDPQNNVPLVGTGGMNSEGTSVGAFVGEVDG